MLIEAMVATTHTRSPLDTRKHAHRVSCYMGRLLGRRELMLWLRVRGWLVRPSRVYFIICRDVHPVRRGQVLKCNGCVESVSAALPPFFPALLSMCLTCTHTRVYACAEGASGILLHACAYA